MTEELFNILLSNELETNGEPQRISTIPQRIPIDALPVQSLHHDRSFLTNLTWDRPDRSLPEWLNQIRSNNNVNIPFSTSEINADWILNGEDVSSPEDSFDTLFQHEETPSSPTAHTGVSPLLQSLEISKEFSEALHFFRSLDIKAVSFL